MSDRDSLRPCNRFTGSQTGGNGITGKNFFRASSFILDIVRDAEDSVRRTEKRWRLDENKRLRDKVQTCQSSVRTVHMIRIHRKPRSQMAVQVQSRVEYKQGGRLSLFNKEFYWGYRHSRFHGNKEDNYPKSLRGGHYKEGRDLFSEKP